MSDDNLIRIFHLRHNENKDVVAGDEHFILSLKDVVVLQGSPAYNFAVGTKTESFPAILYHMGNGLSVVEPIAWSPWDATWKRRVAQWQEARK